jgi:type II secretory pathway predicted ATPase ExeA
MFNEYFGFSKNPFSEDHDIDYFYLNNSNKQLYRDLLNNIYQRVNLTLLLADWGVGKTAFLQQLIGIDPFQLRVIYFHDTTQWPRLIDYLCSEMALAIESNDSDEKERQLTKYLTELHQLGIIPVLIVDNAQELTDDSLASMLRLAGKEVDDHPLIQVILSAAPTFKARFDLSTLQPYKPSISRHYQLQALTSKDVNDFIYFRLRQAGCKRKDLFSDPAVQAIADRSKGIPRLINRLCSSALHLASQANVQKIDEEIITKASQQLCLSPDSVDDDKISSTLTLNNLLDNEKAASFSHEGKSEGSITAEKPSFHWSSQFIRFGAAVAFALVLLLVGRIMLLKSEPEQKQKETRITLPQDVQRQEKKQPLVIGPTKNQAVVLSEKRSETTKKSTSKAIQVNNETSNLTKKEQPQKNEPLVTNPVAHNPVPANADSSTSPEVGTKTLDKSQETALRETLPKNPSLEHPYTSEKPSAENKDSAIPKSMEIEEREQEAKDRALARMKLKQSDIEFGVDALMTAAVSADNKTIELLLAGGIPPDLEEQVQGLTALAIAASNGQSNTVQLLLQAEASINLRVFKGRTALMAAAGNGHTDTVLILLDNGAEVNINDDDGWTALMFAAYGNHVETVHALLERNANVRLKNSVGRTALQIAQSQGHQDIIELVELPSTDTDN